PQTIMHTAFALMKGTGYLRYKPNKNTIEIDHKRIGFNLSKDIMSASLFTDAAMMALTEADNVKRDDAPFIAEVWHHISLWSE
ncbi:hypothetical protein, partial [Escherichia coli]|uniref:hypothetical protein n=1 Tax=Escherichia coli TaxID=562 RepID=UPI00196556E3